MVSELTGGFDFGVQMSTDVVQRVVTCAWEMAAIPHYLHQSWSFAGAEVEGELAISAPTVRLEPGVDTVQLALPFALRLSTTDEVPTGDLLLVTRVVLERGSDLAGSPASTLTVSFASLQDGDVALRFRTDTLLTRAVADVVVGATAALLRDKVLRLPITPSFGGEQAFLTWRVYHNPEFDPVTTPRCSREVLGVFLNVVDRPMAPPVEFRQHLYDQDCALVIPADFVLARLAEARAAAGLANLPARIPGRDDVILDRLSIELLDGQIRVSGSATAEVDFLPDPSIEFSASVLLYAAQNTITVSVGNIDIDIPFWLQALQFDPILGPIITSTVRSAVDSVSGRTVAVPLPPLSFVVGDVPVSAAPAAPRPSLAVAAQGPVRSWRGGLVLIGNIELAYDRVPAQPSMGAPDVVRGHRQTLEFHRPGCEFGDLIRPANLVELTVDEAFREGYNGCASCVAEYTSVVPLEFVAHSTPGQHRVMTVTFEMTAVATFGPHGTDADQYYSATITRWVDESGRFVWLQVFPSLRLGLWRIAVSAGDWQCVTEARVYANQNRALSFVFGADNPTPPVQI